MAYSRIGEVGGEYSLTMACGNLPCDAVVAAAGHEANGYFWEGIATLLAPDLVEHLEMDSDPDGFKATGLRSDLEELRNKLEPVVSSTALLQELLRRAQREGFEFDD